MITITDRAISHLKNSMQAEHVGFRLSIKKTGCSGYAYVPRLIESIDAADLHFVIEHLNIYIDPACATLVEGLTVDYITDNESGIKRKRLVFINPNEKNRCGCGESFTIE